MDKRTVQSAHTRIDGLEKEIVAIKTEMDIQFKDLFNRVKRLEAIMIGTSGFIIVLLLRMNMLSILSWLLMLQLSASLLS